MLFNVLHQAWVWFQELVVFCLLCPILLQLFGLISKRITQVDDMGEDIPEEKDYAIIVPVQQPSPRLESAIQSLLQQQYSNYRIYLLLNNSDIPNIWSQNERVVIVKPEKPIRSSARLYRYVIKQFQRPHTHVAILDINSTADKQYLNELNVYFNKGYQVVQGKHLLKHNYSFYQSMLSVFGLYRYGYLGNTAFLLGSSAALYGCNAAFTISAFKQCLQQVKPQRFSFAKRLECAIINRGYQVAFAPKAVVFTSVWRPDKPMAKTKVHTVQKSLTLFVQRWQMLGSGFAKGNWNQIVFSAISFLPSLPVVLGCALTCIVINIWLNLMIAAIWAACVTLFAVFFSLAVFQPDSFQKEVTEVQTRRMSVIKRLYISKEENSLPAVS